MDPRRRSLEDRRLLDPRLSLARRSGGARMTRANGRLALGTAQLGMAYGVANRRGRLSARDVEAILDAAIALGVRCFDTAPVYGDAEQAIGEWRKRRAPSQEIEISTKLPRLPTEIDVWRFVRDAIERSRQRLNVEVIDHYLV